MTNIIVVIEIIGYVQRITKHSQALCCLIHGCITSYLQQVSRSIKYQEAGKKTYIQEDFKDRIMKLHNKRGHSSATH